MSTYLYTKWHHLKEKSSYHWYKASFTCPCIGSPHILALCFPPCGSLINLVPSHSPNNSSPYFLLNNQHPDFNSLNVFGAKCWPLTTPYNLHKFSYHLMSCAFHGLSPGHKGFIFYHIQMDRACIYKDVKFNELEFPFADLPKPKTNQSSTHMALTSFQSPSGNPFFSYLNSETTTCPLSPFNTNSIEFFIIYYSTTCPFNGD